MEGTESKLVGRGCSVVVGVAGSRSFSMDAPLFVESDPVRNDGVDAHRAIGSGKLQALLASLLESYRLLAG